MMERQDGDAPVIVVADDDDEFRETLTAVLEGEGYRVLSAANGKAALRLLHEFEVDAVVLDWSMPMFGGAEFWRALRTEESVANVPVLVLSGDLRSLGEARRLGVTCALPKPIGLIQLLDIVGDLCRAGALSSPDGHFPAG